MNSSWLGMERERYLCAMPTPRNMLNVFYIFRHFNDRAVYTCDDGYQIVGLEQVICNSDGHWSGAQPMCKQVRDWG